MTEFTKAFSTWPCNSSACDHKNAMCSFSPPMISLAEKKKKNQTNCAKLPHFVGNISYIKYDSIFLSSQNKLERKD